MQRDLTLVGRIVEELDGRIATNPDDFIISLRRNIELWRKEIYRCWLLELPTDILVSIFMNFSPTHVWKLRVICKPFKAAAESEGLWRGYCERFIDTSDPSMRTLPHWWAEYQQHYTSWQAMEAFADDFIFSLETGLRWSAVHESVWRERRGPWTLELRAYKNNAQKLSQLLLEFESNILDATFLPEWKPMQEAWRARVSKAKRVSELALALLQLDDKILPAKYSDSWLNSKQKSWRLKLTVQSPPESPETGGFSFPSLWNRSPFAPQFAYA